MRLTIVEFIVNPPCRDDLTVRQKIGRSLGVSLLLIVGCILMALGGAIVLDMALRLGLM